MFLDCYQSFATSPGMDKSEIAEQSQQRDNSLLEIRAMNDDGLTFGLPMSLFWGGLGLCIAFSFILMWWIGFLFGFVYFSAMYAIHADDPRAVEAWRRAYGRPKIWSGGVALKRRINYKNLDEEFQK